MKLRLSGAAALPVTLLFALTIPAHAQYPTYEVFGGYSLARQRDGANLNGWHGQAALNLSRSFGLVADVSQHYMGDEDGVDGIAGLSDTRVLAYGLGPRATNRLVDPATLFVHALFGQSRLIGQADIGGGSTERRIFRPFTLTLGGGVDYRLRDLVALRIVEIDYRLLRIESAWSNGVRISTGVTFGF
jgi:hypothetical protein